MNANRHPPNRLVVLALGLAGALALASCSERVVPPPPAPSPTPSPVPPPPPPAPQVDWRQAELTPGDWTWGIEGGRSTARFARGELVMRCDARGSTITMLRPGRATEAVPVTIRTWETDRPLTAQPDPGGAAQLAITLPVRDPILDAMAFSRGRFAMEVAGLATLYLPSWPEISRVIEDCR